MLETSLSLRAKAQGLGFHLLPKGRLSFYATLQNLISRVFSLFPYKLALLLIINFLQSSLYVNIVRLLNFS